MIFMQKKTASSVRATLGMSITAACLSMAPSSVTAQSQLSILCPVGLPVQQNSGSSFIMGGTAVAVVEDYNCMLRNPANLGFINKAIFSSQYIYDFTNIRESGAHTNFIDGYPEQISLGIPAGLIGTIGLSYNFTSNTSAKYRQDAQSFGFDTSTIEYKSGIVLSGGTTVWQVGWGRELPSFMHLRIGASYKRVYFASTQTVLRTISDESSTVDSRDSTYSQLKCNGAGGGIMLPLGKFRVGLSGEYFFAGELKVDNAIYSASSDTTNSFGYNSSVPVDHKFASAGMRLPPSLTAGASYMVNKEWQAAVDLGATFWNYYYSHGLLEDSRDDAAISFSSGVQYVPVPTIMNPRYQETIRYGAGFRYTQLSADKSSEYAISVGTGLPIGRQNGLLTFGAEFGRRTNSNYSGLSENFAHLSIGINGGRKWNKSSTGNY
jgi:hypothetical protein